ncbi:MAG: prephenate dehydrogenase/arogenate dehydrogenase family protein [Schwartzia succinivorans]|jgi:prephenate dehydrogenase|uniref:prephenate dehydrogenase n=1 Tax=Schwartzia succinivorans TaxID=55507 RepID=UPI0023526796|nr:prephenate dehydrogenase/arogenate dehydrogenase family protein [Schwartzia succinivorans]MBE6096227.1 prephenate dehydrogenase/arogenate dehydrogenase family protein [Schwartzia succinivorans]
MAKLNLAIIGVGLIGGSFGLALKDKLGEDVHIRGLCRHKESMDAAVKLGAVDEASDDVAWVVKDADLVYLSTPVLQMVPMVKQILPHLKKGAVITDAGSTKKFLMDSITPLLPDDIYYISAHPMTGKEKSGVSAAGKDLFLNKCYVIIKETAAPPDVVKWFEDILTLTGANLTTLPVAQHDRCASIISHVPHVAAAALVTLLERSDEDMKSCIKLAGGGFKDTTRIASSNADMWADICMTNADAITAHLREVQSILDDVIKYMEAKDRQKIHDYFLKAKKRRDSILDTAEELFEI